MYSRTELLLGNSGVRTLKNSHVLVVGLGGVGAYCAEQLVRAGVGSLTIIDKDTIEASNLNRQLVALNSTLGKNKTDVLAQRLLDINPSLHIEILTEYLRDDRMVEILKAEKYDYVVDAIDTLSPKVFLLYHCLALNLLVVSAMGSGGKIDPLQVKIDDISHSYNCTLASSVRKKLHKLGVYDGVSVVFSSEKVNQEAVVQDEGDNKKTTVGTVSYMPAIFGCACASVVIRDLCGQQIYEKKKDSRYYKNKRK
jgi:Dinucleotide-utilizing enzymes involved in molybdopterin and thiamine biosynthesis family 1